MVYNIYTHNDLDAVASRIIIEAGGHTIGVVGYYDYSNIDAAILNYLSKKDLANENILVIPDICPSQGICARLDLAVKNGTKVILLDHHKTRSWVAKYTWAITDNTRSGTELVFFEFVKNKDVVERYRNFVRAVTAWDLWQLDSIHRDRGENLNSLLGFIGKREFVRLFLQNPDADEQPQFQGIIQYLNIRKNNYVSQVIKEQLVNDTSRKMDGMGNTFKIIFATDYLSELGSAVLEHPEAEDIHYVCLINPLTNSCSLRSRAKEVDVSMVAKALGGGGHFSAAGFPVNFTDQIKETAFSLLNRIDY